MNTYIQGSIRTLEKGTAAQPRPQVINTDKNPTYGEVAELKQEGRLPKEIQHRQVKYLNNPLEGDHGNEAVDQIDPLLPVDEDGLCDDQ